MQRLKSLPSSLMVVRFGHLMHKHMVQAVTTNILQMHKHCCGRTSYRQYAICATALLQLQLSSPVVMQYLTRKRVAVAAAVAVAAVDVAAASTVAAAASQYW